MTLHIVALSDSFKFIPQDVISQLFFIKFSASNSSFTQCVRKYNPILSSSSHENSCNSNHPSYTDDRNLDRLECVVTNTDYSFTSCSWQNIHYETNGSCIYLVSSSSQLTIERSSFIDCSADKECGGAIYVYYINKATIHDSIIISCHVLSCSKDEFGGGGAYLEYIIQQCLISSTIFIN